jgi:HEAT repeat protein
MKMKIMSHGLFKSRPARLGRRRLSALLLLALTAAALFTLPGRGRTAHGFNQDLARLNQFVQSGDSPALLVFRQGRDLIEREDWAGAAAKFEGYVTQYPKSKEADAALYWLAYAQKQQRRFQSAEATLDRLLREFPRSAWADDARAMQVEIAPQTGKRVEPEGLDDDLKVVALQSLFQSDPARASAYVTEILRPNSRAGRELKQSAVNLLGQYGGTEAVAALLDIARTQTDPEVRGTAIFRLSHSDDERMIDELAKIYDAERDRDVKGQVLHAFARMDSPRAYAKLVEIARGGGDQELRQTAIHWLGQRRGAAAIDDLMSIYRADRNEEIRGAVLHALSQTRDPRARAAILEAARGGEDPETRARAIHALRQFSDDDATLEDLLRLYDAERDEEVKGGILHALSQSKHERALTKLMDVARTDASREMRKRAIHWLGQTRDPRALKFLQDLLR